MSDGAKMILLGKKDMVRDVEVGNGQTALLWATDGRCQE